MTHAAIQYLLESLLSSILWFTAGATSMWIYLRPMHRRSHQRKGHRR